jgi:Mrp family chromosome partitioning ATPase
MSTTTTIVEDAMRRKLGPDERSIERPVAPSPGNAELPYTRNRIRRMTPLPADLQQARRFARASVDSRTMERNCVLPAVSDTAALRAFKILRTRVLRRLEMNKWNSIAVSGMSVGEGKTLTALNLALALSQDVNTWVFLVDLDLQRPQVANYLGMSFEKGLSDYLLGKAELDQVVYNLQSERLGVIPNARAFQHSSEFLNSPRMSELLNALEREVPRRIVIFDMPPLLVSDDVLAFQPQFDSLLLVVSEGKSGRAMLRGAKEVLSEMNLLGVALNRSRDRNESAYY